MKSKLFCATFLAALCLMLSGCDYDFPLTAKPTHKIDPRLVGDWSLEMNKDGQYQLVCKTTLLDGIEAEVAPPAEKRIAIGGKFLDEVRIRLDRTSYLGFPVENHRAEIATDGTAMIWVKMPTAIQLFAEGRLTPIGGAPVQVMIGGKELGNALAQSKTHSPVVAMAWHMGVRYPWAGSIHTGNFDRICIASTEGSSRTAMGLMASSGRGTMPRPAIRPPQADSTPSPPSLSRSP